MSGHALNVGEKLTSKLDRSKFKAKGNLLPGF